MQTPGHWCHSHAMLIPLCTPCLSRTACHACILSVKALQAAFTASLVNYISDRMRAVLAEHPVNLERLKQGKRPATVVLLRGAGMRLRLPSFHERHGLNACMVSPTKILGGVMPSQTPQPREPEAPCSVKPSMH